MTWNLQWLADHPKNDIQRTTKDYQALKQIFLTHQPDVLAFQEVNSAKSLYRVIPKDQYQVFMSSRTMSTEDKFNGINQFTGFAVKKHLITKQLPDITELSSPTKALGLTSHYPQKLRYGSVIALQLNNQTVSLANLHLKSGCFYPNQLSSNKKKACRTLNLQRQIVQQWVDNQQTKQLPFIIIGDFNHQIHQPPSTNNGFISSSANKPLKWLSQNINGNCLAKVIKNNRVYYRQYKQLIDHGFSSVHFTLNSAQQIQFSKHQLEQYQLTDHCPLLFTLTLTKP
ncbi:endonuclease/exonuclease/phosphatase family protein [Photobacterium lucens]|uniref:endonuclease/exonuclease/phosphatase family protein n=1 Tax=Photobacterium lucens TaxID=2562949 RepID=UPI00136B727D|nr:endonuclease/exonuclease/phosphatase family protein [Photobacterium lucens]MBP2699574.1 endonuclease/exonuclease/phosphatase family protein [Vibrio parahaemolyticus]MZG58217.1 endonuclease/exonuclease/phosphatase family protein [Photobacterium lucens]MZG79306.1 endonuclease/exonuclease/phosphatase family protein [Photobacterium lucens]